MVKPHASYTLTNSERVEFCKFLKLIKFLNGFVSNISWCVNEREGKILGLKMHDCHILLHRLLSICIWVFLLKNVYTTITKVCSFFRDLCARTIRESDLDKLQADIRIILCKSGKNISTCLLQRYGTPCRSLIIWNQDYWSYFLQLDVSHWKKSTHFETVCSEQSMSWGLFCKSICNEWIKRLWFALPKLYWDLIY